MLPILQHSDKLYIGLWNQLVMVNLKTDNITSVQLPTIKIPENVSKGHEDLLKETPEITTVNMNGATASLLAVSTHNKQLVIYDTADLKVLCSTIINRAASKICFDKEDNLVVADKTGDAYVIPFKQEEKPEPQLLLGHLSMLLDVAVSPCGKYIVTCDRDEKIRVSHHKNAYNILCYCLGHQEFVTNVAFINDQLLSASGDGTIKLWNYLNGSELYSFDTNSLIKDVSKVTLFKDKMDKDNVEVNAIPVTDMQVYQFRDGFALIALTLFNINCIHIIEYDYAKKTLVYVQSIGQFESILSFSLNHQLIVMNNNKLHIFNYNQVENHFVESKSIQLDQFNEDIIQLCKKNVDSDVSVLYKRKFDNVQEYLERKKQRLGVK